MNGSYIPRLWWGVAMALLLLCITTSASMAHSDNLTVHGTWRNRSEQSTTSARDAVAERDRCWLNRYWMNVPGRHIWFTDWRGTARLPSQSSCVHIVIRLAPWGLWHVITWAVRAKMLPMPAAEYVSIGQSAVSHNEVLSGFPLRYSCFGDQLRFLMLPCILSESNNERYRFATREHKITRCIGKLVSTVVRNARHIVRYEPHSDLGVNLSGRRFPRVRYMHRRDNGSHAVGVSRVLYVPRRNVKPCILCKHAGISLNGGLLLHLTQFAAVIIGGKDGGYYPYETNNIAGYFVTAACFLGIAVGWFMFRWGRRGSPIMVNGFIVLIVFWVGALCSLSHFFPL